MTNLDHDRPILKLIDAMQRERQRLAAPLAPSGKIGSVIKRALPRAGARRDRELVHETAVAVFAHYAKSHDWRPLRMLLEAVGDDRSRAALIKWLCTYGPLTVDAEGTLKHVKGRPTLIGAATLDPYWKHYPKMVAPAFDPVAELERVERRIAKYGSHTPGSDHVNLRNELRSLIERHRA